MWLLCRQCFEIQCQQDGGNYQVVAPASACRCLAMLHHTCSMIWLSLLSAARPCELKRRRSYTFVQGRCNADANSRSVMIMISDSCPGCEADHVDLQVSLWFLPCSS